MEKILFSGTKAEKNLVNQLLVLSLCRRSPLVSRNTQQGKSASLSIFVFSLYLSISAIFVEATWELARPTVVSTKKNSDLKCKSMLEITNISKRYINNLHLLAENLL
jgi:hypothetical protein